MIGIPKVMISQLDLILKNHNKLSQYYKDGFKIIIDLNDSSLIVYYKSKIYNIHIEKENDDFYWILSPYNKSYFKTKIDMETSNFDILIFAIKENEELYN